MDPSIAQKLDALLGERATIQAPLSRRSSLRIGGAAAAWVEPHTRDELARLIALARDHGLEVVVTGLGSNTLFPDEGIDGLVIRLGGELASWSLEPTAEGALITVGAGCVNAHLVRAMLAEGLVGAEFLMLIPGTVGGAVALNAGTREQDLASILTHVEWVRPGPDGQPICERVPASQVGLEYRHAELPEGAVVASATLALARGDVEGARARAQADRDRRDRTQPYRYASVGSTFANPPGDYAGRLIDAAGLKGLRVGGAHISPLHANFFINDGQATAGDFLGLMARARLAVRRAFDVELVPEVRFVGFDGWARLLELERQLADWQPPGPQQDPGPQEQAS